MSPPALFPADWIRAADEAAEDLELAVLLSTRWTSSPTRRTG